jgi:hypothetical protein
MNELKVFGFNFFLEIVDIPIITLIIMKITEHGASADGKNNNRKS